MASTDSDDEVAQAKAEQPADVAVAGITPNQYAMWFLNDPVAQMFFKFLTDYRDDLVKSVMEDWENNSLTLANEHERRGYARALKEMTTVRIPQMHRFYEERRAVEEAKREEEERLLKEVQDGSE